MVNEANDNSKRSKVDETSKRKLVEMNNQILNSKRMKAQEDGVDPHNPPVALVVHVRALSESVRESDINEAVRQFGEIKDVVMMQRKRQALVEFKDVNSAKSCVDYCKSGMQIFVAGQPALFNYSTSGKIIREGDEESGPNAVLLFTVVNPQYPVTVDVLHKINTPYGTVNRIVTFKKNGVQAMVEFDSVESAQRAKESLNGADIYEGCCTLRILFAKPKSLVVARNDSDNWDFTKGDSPRSPNRGPALLSVPGRNIPNGPPSAYGSASAFGASNDYYDVGPQGSVCIVYNLDAEKMNCDKLFNMFCQYGNIVRVKFLRTKDGTAMVQLGDSVSIQRAVEMVNGITLYGKKIKVALSKQAYLNIEPNPYDLEDGTKSYEDYTASRNNRFTRPEASEKNRPVGPSKVVHYYNAPPKFAEADLIKIFQKVIGQGPTSVTQFPSKTERSSTGLVEFEKETQAVEAVVAVNHYPIEVDGVKNPFLLKLCFAKEQS